MSADLKTAFALASDALLERYPGATLAHPKRYQPRAPAPSQWIAELGDHYERKTGMRLFPGTLNVHLDAEYRLPSKCLRLEGAEYAGSVSINLVPCTIFGRQAFILRTDANETEQGDHPRSVIEIATDIKLRDAFELVDGSDVVIKVP